MEHQKDIKSIKNKKDDSFELGQPAAYSHAQQHNDHDQDHVWEGKVYDIQFHFYRFDKRQSMQEGAGRIPELVLLAMTVLGGFLGAWAGMFQRPRHKVRKTVFWVALVVGTVLQVWLFFVLYL